MRKILLDPVFIMVVLVVLVSAPVSAQLYNGTTGLIHIPSAEMNRAGDVRVGANFISRELLPDNGFSCPDDEGVEEKYNSFSYYFSITPFSWVEVAYTCVLLKLNDDYYDAHGYTAKDRHFALKLNPLKEGRYYPAVAVGVDDFVGSSFDADHSQQFFCNFWLAVTKHFSIGGHELGVTLGGRYYNKDFNKKYNGVNGAVTYCPPLSEKTMRIVQPRAMLEYDGCHVNCGVNALLWSHLLVQASLTDFSVPSAGIAYQVNLLYKNRKKHQSN